MRAAHAELARKIGYPDNRIHMMTNGEILEFDAKGNARRSKQKLTLQDVVIDGYGSAGEGQRIMDDRKIMSSNGVIVIALKAYAESKRLVGDPDILARGLIYGSEQTEITGEAIKIAKKAYEESLNRGESDRKGLKRAVNGALFRFFDRKLNRKPMIIPIVIEV
jgi:ribonuclease J